MASYLALLATVPHEDGRATYSYGSDAKFAEECENGDLFECGDCGVAVTDATLHDRFHRRMNGEDEDETD